MRSILVVGLLLVTAALPALGRLVQPDGSEVALGEDTGLGSRTLVFPAQAVPVPSWLLLPAGTTLTSTETIARGERRQWSYPWLRIPGLRYAVHIPAHTLSLTLHGRVPANLVVVRSLTPPPQGGEPWLVRAKAELRVDLPRWKTATGWTSQLELTRPVDAPWRVRLSDNEQTRTFTFDASVRHWAFSPQAWGFHPVSLIVQGHDPRLSQVKVRAIDAAQALPADPISLVTWPRAQWRDSRREWFHWEGTSVLVLVSADYRVQDAYLKRLAFFVEKTGYRGRVSSEEDLASLHAWNAHDYAAADLARFFTQAAAGGFALNPSEQELRDRLVTEGILVETGSLSWKAGIGALVGISDESPPALKSTLFVHEAFHGLYFTTQAFRVGVKGAWDGLSEPARQQFRIYLSRSRYDPTDEGLMINEFQAYVLQRSAAEWEAFFRDRVLGGNALTAGSLTWLAEYLGAARSIDALVRRLFGISSGTVSAVTPS